MRKLTFVSIVLALALTSMPVAAANGDRTVGVTFHSVTFTSILGGSVSGNAYVEGSISNGSIGELRGTANLPVRDQRVSIAPSGALVLTTQRLQVNWWRSWCDQFSCYFTSGLSVYEQQFSQGPVDVRLGTMRGTGTLHVGTNPVCIEACPPAGASYWVPGGYTNLFNAGVLGSQDAGIVNMSGAPPVIN